MAVGTTCSECEPGTVIGEACRESWRSECADARDGCHGSGGDCNADFVLEACTVRVDARVLECTIEECTEATRAYVQKNEFFLADVPPCVVKP
ncbi:MAG: hypothetical protein AAGF92_02255 [Myxococcota bacterium]